MTMGNSNARATRTTLGLALGAGFLFFLTACATIGRDFDASKVYDVRIGNTTQAEIQAMFGRPWRVGIEDGKLTWTYGSYHYSAFSEARTKDLVVRFDANNVVVSYTFNTTDAAEIGKFHGPGRE
jgi:hypothetical protein